MKLTKNKLWRLIYRTDMRRADSATVPLAVFLEVAAEGVYHWLGCVHRDGFTDTEQAAMNLQTWPELASLNEFLTRILDEAWDASDGLESLVARYPVHSAVQLVADEPPTDLAGEVARFQDFHKVAEFLGPYMERFLPEVTPTEATRVPVGGNRRRRVKDATDLNRGSLKLEVRQEAAYAHA